MSTNSQDGSIQLERELVYYGRIVDFADLAGAAEQIDQEQWEVRLPKDEKNEFFGGVRVRKTTSPEPDGGRRTEYTLTVKTLKDDVSGKDEVEIITTEDMFEMIKRLSSGGSIKTRYLFPIDGTHYTWEVDVYQTSVGGLSDWCKIDLEIKDPDYQPPDFPIQLTEVIKNQPADRSEDEIGLVQKLMDEEFILPNPYPKVSVHEDASQDKQTD